MQEIHQIQLELHEEMKDMTPEERVEKINENAREFVKKHNLKLDFVDKH